MSRCSITGTTMSGCSITGTMSGVYILRSMSGVYILRSMSGVHIYGDHDRGAYTRGP